MGLQRLQSLYPASSASDNVSNVPIVSGSKPRTRKHAYVWTILR